MFLAVLLSAFGLIAGPGAEPARAAGPFVVTSNAYPGNDAAVGDGVCADGTGACTLRAAVQEANASATATSISVASAMTITPTCSAYMTTGAVPGATAGAFYTITAANVTIDFGNRLSVANANCEAATFYVNGANATLANGTGIFGGRVSFALGPNGDGAVIANMTLVQSSTSFAQSAVSFGTGADDVTVRGSTFGGFNAIPLNTPISGTIRFESGATVAGPTIVGNSFVTDTTLLAGCSAFDGRACRTNGIASVATSVTGLTIRDNTFSDFGAAASPIGFAGGSTAMTGLAVVGNRFTGVAGGALLGYAATVSLPGAALGPGSQIVGNTFAATASSPYAITWAGTAAAGTTTGNLSITDNVFTGYGLALTSIISVTGGGSFTVERNIFGTGTIASQISGVATENGSTDNVVFRNANAASNSQVRGWYPGTASVSGCTLTVTTVAPTQAPVAIAPARLDLYWSRSTSQGAEILLGSVTAASAGATPSFVVPYAAGLANGRLRIQTQSAPRSPGAATQSSQYSRVISPTIAASTCAPAVTVNQAPGQEDPTSRRDIRFRVVANAPLNTASLTASDFSTTGSTAPGVTVTAVTPLDVTDATASIFEVVARGNGTGTVVLSLPAGAATAAGSNAATAASTSTDNSVPYVNPLSAAPTALTVYEGAPSVPYQITRSRLLPPTTALTVAISSSTAYAVVPATATLTPSATTTAVPVTSGVLGGVPRSAAITQSVTAGDAAFLGLIVPSIAVTALPAATLTPTSGPTTGGTAVSVTVNHLPAAVTGITFGGIAATVSGTGGSLVATTPPRPTTTGLNETVNVVISYANGTSVTLPNAFTYIPTSSMSIVKSGFADAARTQPLPTGTEILAGQQVWWAYVVTNTGETTLTALTVTDPQLPAGTYPGGVVCTVPTLARAVATTCTATAVILP